MTDAVADARRRKVERTVRWFAIHVLMLCVAAIFIFPLYWMVTTSFKPFEQAVQMPPSWTPSPWQWENYPEAMEKISFWRLFYNTMFLCVMNVIGTVFSCSLVAYGFSRIEWAGRDKFFAVTLATMMVPGPVLLIPIYGLFRDLGWIGTLRPLWVPAFFASAYNIFLLRQFFLGIPKDLSEAARIDGCNEFRIFWQIILPLTKPALIVVGLFSFMYVWNDFMSPLIYLTDSKLFTLALGLQSFQSQLGGAPLHHLMAAATLMILPVFVLFMFGQRFFIEGISLTGLKG